MKKKFLSSLLFAALVGGATSTFTACKDYDDDINNIQSQVDQLKELKAVKTEVDKAISDLKSQLESADAALRTAIDAKADKEALANLEARVITLESKVKTLEEAKTTLEEMIGKKADKTYVDGLYANLLTVDGKLAEPLKKLVQDEAQALVDAAALNLQQQIDAISKMTNMPDGTKSPLVEALTALKNNVGEYSIKDLADNMQANADAISKINAELNLLTVLCSQQLRSLVFQPQAYYWGVEATRLFTLDNVKYSLKGTAYNQFETSTLKFREGKDYGYENYDRWPDTPFFKVLDFVAEYHMNPSTAVLDPEKHSVTILSDDKEFITRSAEAGLSVAKEGWTAKNGVLSVNLTVSDKDKIKSVNDDQAITVFAAQAHIGDTVVTSDYATIVKKNISDVKLYHKVAEDVNGEYGTYTSTVKVHPITGQPVSNGFVEHTAAHNQALGIPVSQDTGIPEWSEEVSEPNKTRAQNIIGIPYSATLGPVLGTVHQTVDYFPQDWVVYDCNEVDLTKFVTVRVWDGSAPIEVKPEELGLHYKFELTALHLLDGAMVGADGAAHTSESAHAAINGNMFRPQMVERETGAQKAYGSEQDVQTVGRTPVVRVSLVDDDNNVYDYGYFRILILNKNAKPQEDTTVPYTGPDWTYAYECTPKGWEWSNTWSQVEYDLYKKVGMSRDEFVANYYNNTLGTDGPQLKPNSSTEFQQYVLDSNNRFVAATPAQEVGVVTQISGIDEDGTETSTLKWIVNSSSVLNSFTTGSQYNKQPAPKKIAVKYVSIDKTKGPDIYVVLETGKITILPRPEARISWDALKNPSYWYANNSNVSATTGQTPIAEAIEMHNNVLTPQDNTDPVVLSKNFRQTISSTMLNNKIDGKLFVEWTTAPAAQAASDYAATGWVNDLVFSNENNGKTYVGESGTVYTMVVTNNNKTLAAYIAPAAVTTAKPVAQIVGVGADAQQIVYGGNTNTSVFDFADYGKWEYAKDLLNYKAHNALDDKTIRAIVGVNIKNSCNMEVAHNDATFDVRFLRPINVKDLGKEIEDANVSQMQTFDIAKLVDFTDWREDWKDNPSYINYYGIKSISIDGLLSDGDKLSDNEKVITNQSGSDKPLKDVNAAIEFYYTAPVSGEIAGKLTYKNFSSTVDQFYVKIPVTVEYFWGKITTTVTVNVKSTAGNNAPHK